MKGSGGHVIMTAWSISTVLLLTSDPPGGLVPCPHPTLRGASWMVSPFLFLISPSGNLLIDPYSSQGEDSLLLTIGGSLQPDKIIAF